MWRVCINLRTILVRYTYTMYIQWVIFYPIVHFLKSRRSLSNFVYDSDYVLNCWYLHNWENSKMLSRILKEIATSEKNKMRHMHTYNIKQVHQYIQTTNKLNFFFPSVHMEATLLENRRFCLEISFIEWSNNGWVFQDLTIALETDFLCLYKKYLVININELTVQNLLAIHLSQTLHTIKTHIHKEPDEHGTEKTARIRRRTYLNFIKKKKKSHSIVLYEPNCVGLKRCFLRHQPLHVSLGG